MRWGDAGAQRCGERGAATVLLLALSAVLAVCASALVSLAAVGATRARAESAADLAALAAATARQRGQDPCSAAAGVVPAGGELVLCAVEGESVRVEVHVLPPGPLSGLGRARGRARAGPG